MTTWSNIFASKFKPVYREINSLLKDIDDKEWFLFFSWHTKSQEDLFKSPHHDKIISFSEKISSDTMLLRRKNKISQQGLNVYSKHDENTKKWLVEIEKRIQNRDGTVWENIAGFCKEFTRRVVDILKFPLIKPFLSLPLPVGLGLHLLKSNWDDEDKARKQRLLEASSSFRSKNKRVLGTNTKLFSFDKITCPNCGETNYCSRWTSRFSNHCFYCGNPLKR